MKEEFMDNFDLAEKEWRESWRPGGYMTKKVDDFITEVTLENPEWVKERRLEYLENQVAGKNQEIDWWKNEANKYNSWFKDKILKICCFPIEKERDKILREISSYKNPVWKQIAFGKIDGDMVEKARETPIENLMEFNRAGFALCIFHSEKTPSLKLRKGINRFHCFGCSRNGSAIDIIMQLKNLDFKRAVKFLNNICG